MTIVSKCIYSLMIWGHTQWCSGFTCLCTQRLFLVGSKNHMKCWRLKLCQLHVRQEPYLVYFLSSYLSFCYPLVHKLLYKQVCSPYSLSSVVILIFTLNDEFLHIPHTVLIIDWKIPTWIRETPFSRTSD